MRSKPFAAFAGPPTMVIRGGRGLAVAFVALLAAAATLLACGSPAPTTPTRSAIDPADLPDLERARVKDVGVGGSGNLWVLRAGALYSTSDGGVTWQPWDEPVPVWIEALGQPIFVWDEMLAWAVTAAESVSLTVDGGHSWREVTLPARCSPWVGLDFYDPQIGYLVCFNTDRPTDANRATATVMVTNDGGDSWSVATPAARTPSGWLGTSIAATSDETMWAAAISQETGTQPHLAVSRDAGKTWTDAAIPGLDPQYRGAGRVLPVGPPLLREAHGAFALLDRSSPNQPMLRAWETADGGLTWDDANGPRAVAGPVALIAPDTWLAVAPEGAGLLLTNDAGRSWQSISATGLPMPVGLSELVSTNGRDDLAVAELVTGSGDVWLVAYLSHDAGETWQLTRFDN